MEKLIESFKNQTLYSLQLTKHVMEKEVESPNLVFSPLSIHVVLSLIAAAAGSKGETLSQLLTLLRSGSIQELNSLSSEIVASVLADGSHLGGPETCYANSVWIQDHLPLKPSFKDIADNIYRASVNQVDFIHKADEIHKEVDLWAEKETRGLIKGILPAGSVTSSTRLILANALYFKGAWEKKFDAEQTKEYDFHLLNGDTVRVPFMTSRTNRYISKYDGFKVLRLPYRQGEDKRRLSMYIFLPKAKEGLPALVEKVTSEPGFLDRHLKVGYAQVGIFRIPKFKISYGFEASDVLSELGLDTPFGLREIVDSHEGSSLQLSGVIHKSFIEVDEQGTQAAAVTCTGTYMSLWPTIDFVAHHPFLFLIREDVTGVVLFIGRVLDPSLSS